MKILLFFFFLTLSSFAAVDYPVTFRFDGYFDQYMPKTFELFEDGASIVKMDIVRVKKKDYKFYYYFGAGFYLTMGYQHEDIVFDPRASHYSIISGGRLELKKHNLDLGLLHDCFHDIDREIGVTEIWNVIYFGTYTLDYSKMKQNRNYSIKRFFGKKLYYSAYMWYFPYWHLYSWMQNGHGFKFSLKGILDYPAVEYKRGDLSLYSDLQYFYDENNRVTHNNRYGIKFRYFGDDGIVEFIMGYVMDNQNIKPRHNKYTLGLNFHY